MKKQLFLSEENKIIAGICGGIAEYFKVDPVFVRLIWVILTFTTVFAGGILAYIIAWIIIPEKPVVKPKKKKTTKKKKK